MSTLAEATNLNSTTISHLSLYGSVTFRNVIIALPEPKPQLCKST